MIPNANHARRRGSCGILDAPERQWPLPTLLCALVAARPGGNATGVNLQSMEVVAKQLGMLRELAPGANHFFALRNPNSAFTDTIVKDLQASTSALGLPIEILRAGTGREIDVAGARKSSR